MIKILLSTILLTAAALTASAQTAAPKVIELWPEGVPGLRKDASEEKMVNGRVVNVHRPTLTIFAPERGRSNGTAVIFCPGGGYVRLAVGSLTTGPPEARWLVERGATLFVLRYRMVEYGHPAPLQDVLRAMRLVRSRASEFGVRADRVGLLGVSAGGHLAASAAEMFDAAEGRTGAALDSVSARPDFVALVYPVVTMEDPFVHKGSRESLLGASPKPELVQLLSLEKHARKDSPPVFLVATEADKSVPVENTLMLYRALRDAGVAAEMHVYAQGSHGDSLDAQYGTTALWPQRCEEWMRANGWLPKS